MLIEMARVACEVRSKIDKSVDATAEIKVTGPDITERDNATLALALGRAYPQLADLFDREGIDDKEFLRLIYKMFAEVWQGKTTPKIKRKPLTAPSAGAAAAPNPGADETDPKDEGTEE
jgi:hypothetical protein